MPSNPKVRPSFIRQMQRELRRNQIKGDWRRWRPSIFLLVSELAYHQAKLVHALYTEQPKRVREFAADVANYAMKAHEMYGCKKTKNQKKKKRA